MIIIKNNIFFNRELKPITSLLIILCALLGAAFFKITLRKMSYSLHQKNKAFHQIQDQYYANIKKYRKMTQTARLEDLARQHSLEKKKKGQIIQVIDGKALVID